MSSTLQMNDAVLAGVPRLLQDLQTLLDTHDHADILFLLGREETAFYAHRLLLNVRYVMIAVLLVAFIYYVVV